MPARRKPAAVSFKARLYAPMEGKGWTFLDLPASASAALGSRARVPVKGTLNGFAFRSSALPLGDGRHQLPVNLQMRQGAQAGPGDRAEVVLEVDRARRVVAAPRDLARALAGSKAAAATWKAFSYSHRKEYVDWIEEAKRPETRRARILKALERLAQGKPQRQGEVGPSLRRLQD